MHPLSSFTFLTLNGFYQGSKGDTSWHRHGEEESAYALEGLQTDSLLLFGRKTYDMMAGFWPTAQAATLMPEMARGMNAADKMVVSRSLRQASWQNTRIVQGDLIPAIRDLKAHGGKPITVLGSGQLLAQLAAAGLVDTFQVMIDPVALGVGTPFLQGIGHSLDLQLSGHRIFSSGVVLLTYVPSGI
ncbi:dihydrofolate reductase family protein [Paraflavitalea pollutisoli]|uniref:dihydrofolate reductase family protein n=1 Tax=Paraflavitalea pollutisoli TaxID=3034143 RepID=UPI0023EBD535|nr:dihydrofolate reductase family protein [Paraflavitalea sp. H1-2-19X]